MAHVGQEGAFGLIGDLGLGAGPVQFRRARLHLPFQVGIEIPQDGLGLLEGGILALDEMGMAGHAEHQDLQQGDEEQTQHADAPGDPGLVPLEMAWGGEDRQNPGVIANPQLPLPARVLGQGGRGTVPVTRAVQSGPSGVGQLQAQAGGQGVPGGDGDHAGDLHHGRHETLGCGSATRV